MNRILAIDLGTDTGIAFDGSSGLQYETLTLATPKEVRQWGKFRLTRRSDPRISRLYDRLCALIANQTFDIIIFEDVEFIQYQKQAQLWASLRTAVWLAARADKRDVTVECVPVTTLKKFATGSGGANKEAMILAAEKSLKLPPKSLTDDQADAIHLYRWAQKHLARI